MTARKKAPGIKTTRKGAPAKKRRAATTAKQKSRFARIEAELPANLRDYAKQVHKQLNALERDIERAIPQARRRTARLIREASHQLGAMEARGQKAWRERAEQMTKDAQSLLRRLEKAIAPAPRKRATTSKKKGTAKRSANKAGARR